VHVIAVSVNMRISNWRWYGVCMQMEKTVEIDESNAILKDLERLRSGPLESMPVSAHDVDNHEEVHPTGHRPSLFKVVATTGFVHEE
jgi:hypothetical protein